MNIGHKKKTKCKQHASQVYTIAVRRIIQLHIDNTESGDSKSTLLEVEKKNHTHTIHFHGSIRIRNAFRMLELDLIAEIKTHRTPIGARCCL